MTTSLGSLLSLSGGLPPSVIFNFPSLVTVKTLSGNSGDTWPHNSNIYVYSRILKCVTLFQIISQACLKLTCLTSVVFPQTYI